MAFADDLVGGGYIGRMDFQNLAIAMALVLMMGLALVNRDFEAFNRSRILRWCVYFARVFMALFFIAGIITEIQTNLHQASGMR